MITEHKVEQRSDEWFALRCGRITASSFGIVMGKPGVTRTKYLRKLAAQRVTGVVQEGYTNAAMQRGVDEEPNACAFYELMNDCTVTETGFFTRDDLPLCGCSPDGLVGEDGVVEFKVPGMDVHAGYLCDGHKVPAAYRWQVAGHLLFTGRSWCDFMSYSPEGMRPHLVRVIREDVEDDLTKLTHGLLLASEELRAYIKTLDSI
jgi:putative phage-type endonuclease